MYIPREFINQTGIIFTNSVKGHAKFEKEHYEIIENYVKNIRKIP